MKRISSLRTELLARLQFEPATVPALSIDLDRSARVLHAALGRLEELCLVRRQGTKRIGRKRAYVFYAVEHAP